MRNDLLDDAVLLFHKGLPKVILLRDFSDWSSNWVKIHSFNDQLQVQMYPANPATGW